MHRRIAAMLCMGGFALPVASAGAESYRIVDGRLDDFATGAADVLEGVLEVSVFESEGEEIRPSFLVVDDFQLQAGARDFGPAQPVEFEGRGAALWVQIADQIQFDGDRVGFVYLRSGGELVAVDAGEVTFRFLDFRADRPNAGRLAGHIGDTLLPRRMSLRGTLYEVDQRFRLPRGDCTISAPPLPGDGGDVTIGAGDPPAGSGQPGDGGVVIIGGGGVIIDAGDVISGEGGVSTGGVIHSFESFDIEAGETVTFRPPEGGGGLLTRVTGGNASSLEGTLRDYGSVVLLDPTGVVFETSGTSPGEPLIAMDGTASATAPTLAELGITAPSGAEVTFDDAGALTVRSEGDLIVAGGVIDIPGLTSLTLVTPGSITVEGVLQLPPDVALSLNAGEIVIGGEIPGPGDIVIEPPPPIIVVPVCDGLLPVFPADERELGTFSLVASALQQVEIDVRPRHPGHGPPGRHGIVRVAILGSAELDVRDVVKRSLRLGPGEAKPIGSHWHGRPRRVDVNRDGEKDLVVGFDAREAGIAPCDPGVCLFGETIDGTPIEGCDAIETKPKPKRPHPSDRDDDDRPDRGRWDRPDRGRWDRDDDRPDRGRWDRDD